MTKKPFSLFLFALLLCVTKTFAQYELNGRVITKNQGEKMPYAAVSLFMAQDSTFYKGTSADDEGLFRFENVEKGIYFLEAVFMSNVSERVAVDVMSDTNFGSVVLPEAVLELEEVVVAYKKPSLKRYPDRLVFEVENTIVSSGNSWDVLRNTPGVVYNQNQIEIKGQAAEVYINGKAVPMSFEETLQLLKVLSGSQIQSVEVISNPSAKYDAEAAAIVNINTSANINPGYKSTLRLNYTQGIFPKYELSSAHFYKSNRFSAYFTYALNPKKERDTGEKGIRFIQSNTETGEWVAENQLDIKSTPQLFSTNLEYELSDRQTISLQSFYSTNKNQDFQSTQRTSIFSSALDSIQFTNGNEIRSTDNLAVDLTYELGFEQSEAKLKLNVHKTLFDETTAQNLNSAYSDPSNTLLNEVDLSLATDRLIDINIQQLDYTIPFQENHLLSLGAKNAVIDSENNINTQISFTSGGGQAPLSDRFVYEEQVQAYYVQSDFSWDQSALSLGLRSEQSLSKGTSSASGEVNEFEINGLFPSMAWSYYLNESSSITIDYARKIDRPRYQDLNPFRLYSTENDFLEGNPNLKPSFSNNLNLNLSLSNWYFDLYYRDNGQYISYLVFQDNDNRLLREYRQNVLSSNSYGLDVTYVGAVTNFWQTYLYLSLFYEDETFIAEASDNQAYTNEIQGVLAFLKNDFVLNEEGDFTAELSASYFSKYLFGSYVQSPITLLNVGLRKTFNNDRIVLSLSAEDLLGKANALYTSRYLNQDNYFRTVPETQFVKFGVQFNLGNFKLTEKDLQLDKSERSRLEDKG